MSPETAAISMHLDEDQCADLVLDLMSEHERDVALVHAATCVACEARLRAHVSAAERATADRLAHVEPLRIARRGPTRGLLAGGLAIAASVLALFSVPRLLRGPQAATGSVLTIPGDEVLRRDSGAADPHLFAGLAAVRAHDLATARRELEAASASGPAEAVRRLYLAQALEASGEPAAALVQLRGVRFAELPEPWRSEGAVLFARVLRRTGRAGLADSVEQAQAQAGSETPRLP